MLSTIEKPCIRCGVDKPLEDFYAHPQMANGRLNACKTCVKLDAEARRRRLAATDPEWAAKEAERHRQKAKRQQAAKKHDPVHRERQRVSKALWARRNPKKTRAQALARAALQRGEIKPATACQRCNGAGVRLEMHHEDYEKPLEVEFLCCECHGKTRRIK